MWVFGYGSLVWKVDFPFEYKITGYIKGYLRRFYQHSIDHRGVPEKPGRVVTLIKSSDPEAKVYGVAYKINDDNKGKVTDHLDYREKNGYVKKTVTFYPIDKSLQTLEITLYVATEENESFAGPASIEEIAEQVFRCEGPSGTNKEYVYRLAEAMRHLAPEVEDVHLFALEKAVKTLDNTSERDAG